MAELTVALAQMAVATGRPDLNEEMARSLAAQAAGKGVQLLVLPELWHSGYDLERAGGYAAALGEGPFALTAELARAHQLHVAGTALEANPGGRPFNTAVVYGPDGALAGAYHKVHLWAPLGEVDYMSAGEGLPAFDLPWGRTAFAICYDLRFPEMWRRYADVGVEVMVIPAAWPVRRVEHWRVLLRARAVENQFFVIACNRAGADVDGEYGGHSTIVDPWARNLVEGGSEPGLLVATLDLDEVGRARGLFPFLDDRRPEVYG
jgi:predicted amidohydrolase